MRVKNTGAEMKNSIKGLKLKLREYLGNRGQKYSSRNYTKIREPVQEVYNPNNNISQQREQRKLRQISSLSY